MINQLPTLCTATPVASLTGGCRGGMQGVGGSGSPRLAISYPSGWAGV
jgi:hypothetical protein